MTLKRQGLIIWPLLAASAFVQADTAPTIKQFVSLNNTYCEKPVDDAQKLATKLAADQRLQFDKDTNLYAVKTSSSQIGIIPHPQGCTTFSTLNNTDIKLNDLVAALALQGYKKISQDISTTADGMMSQTSFTKKENNAVLIYPLDKQAKQQVSLTTSNYVASGLIKMAGMPTDKEAVEMHRKNAGIARKDGWYPASSTKGNYSVLLPIKFNDLTVKANDAENVKSVEMLVASSSEGIKFLSSRTFYTEPEKAEGFFQNFVTGKALPEAPRRSLKFKGYDAVLIENSNQQLATSQLVIKAENTLLVMAVEWPIVHTEAAKKLGDVFFNSLEVKK